MASLIEQLVQTHGSEVASQLSGKLGIPEDKAAGLLPALAPMILGGLQRQAQEHGGADRVDHILDKHADESVLDNLGDFFSRKADEPAEQADPGLGGLLGGAGGQASQMIGNQLGLSQDQADRIVADAKTASQREKDQALAEIELAKNDALGEVTQKSVDIALGLAKSILGREVQSADHDSLIKEALEKFPV